MAEIGSEEPVIELPEIEQPWSIANSSSIGGGNFTYFSAVCWFYARDLYQYLNYPLGLVATSYGGTPIRSWMNTEARAICNESTANCPNQTEPLSLTEDVCDSCLWNAMIYPWTQTTIRAALWYQV